jgi:hypothetical protein
MSVSGELVLAAATGVVEAVARRRWRGRDGWRELSAKLSAFRLFRAGDAVGWGGGDLAAALAAASPGGAGDGLWIAEGWGHGRTRHHLTDGRAWRPPDLDSLPAAWRVPLATGGSLALAGYRPAVAASVDGEWRLLVWEATGFLASVRRPRERGRLGTAAAAAGGDAAAAFWHGTGRGLYYAAGEARPWAAPPSPGPGRVARLVPHRLGRVHAAAGLAMAATLTTLAHPEVAGRVLRRLAPRRAGGSGAAAALAVWLAAAGLPAPVEALAGSMPAVAAARARAARLLTVVAAGRVAPLLRYRPPGAAAPGASPPAVSGPRRP